LVLTASPGGVPASAVVKLVSAQSGDVTEMPDHNLEQLRLDNPAARLLPILRALAINGRHTINMHLSDDQRLVVEVES
jgi:hypothetical protein